LLPLLLQLFSAWSHTAGEDVGQWRTRHRLTETEEALMTDFLEPGVAPDPQPEEERVVDTNDTDATEDQLHEDGLQRRRSTSD